MAINITMAAAKMGEYLSNELEHRSVSVRADPSSVLENHAGS